MAEAEAKKVRVVADVDAEMARQIEAIRRSNPDRVPPRTEVVRDLIAAGLAALGAREAKAKAAKA